MRYRVQWIPILPWRAKFVVLSGGKPIYVGVRYGWRARERAADDAIAKLLELNEQGLQ